MAEIEVWKSIPGFPGYEASNLGRIKAIPKLFWNANAKKEVWRKERMMKGKHSIGRGYVVHTVNLGRNKSKRMLAHRLIALAHIPNPNNKPFINHINGIKHDNRVDNLEWVTKSENGIHAVNHGLHKPLRGSLNGMTVLTEELVREIRRLRDEKGNKHKEIAAQLGLKSSTVRAVACGQNWAWLK